MTKSPSDSYHDSWSPGSQLGDSFQAEHHFLLAWERAWSSLGEIFEVSCTWKTAAAKNTPVCILWSVCILESLCINIGIWLSIFTDLFADHQQLWHRSSYDLSSIKPPRASLCVSLAGISGHVEAEWENSTGLVTGYFLPSLQVYVCRGGGLVNISKVPSSFKVRHPCILCTPFHSTGSPCCCPQLASLEDLEVLFQDWQYTPWF